MTLIAVLGDGATTTALGLASSWHGPERVLLAELDPAGGVAAGWLDLPAAPGLAELAASSSPDEWPVVESVVQCSARGVEVLVAPARSREAAAAVAAIPTSTLSMLDARPGVVVVGDGGRCPTALPPLARCASVVVVAHRQRHGSAAAAALGIERAGELCRRLDALAIPVVIALIGQQPYSAGEVSDHLKVAVAPVADDAWAAAVLSGRVGSARRLARSPLIRSCRGLSEAVGRRMPPSTTAEPGDDPMFALQELVADER